MTSQENLFQNHIINHKEFIQQMQNVCNKKLGKDNKSPSLLSMLDIYVALHGYI